MSKKPRLFILDANALLHRAWHAVPPLTNPEGKVVNAVYGMLSIIMKVADEHKPDAMVACWDTDAPTFRHKSYKEYKATRTEQPDELYDQIPWVKESLIDFGVDSLELDGFEADDLLGTVAVKAVKEGWDVMIVTGDRDALQLVQPNIRVMSFKKGVTDTVIYDEEEVKKQFGLTPEQFLSYKAIRGDTSDNIPGIRGIGEKGATDLLQTYQTLEGVFCAAHDPKSKLAAGIRAKLLEGEKVIPHMLELVTIVKSVPIEWTAKTRSSFPKNPEAFVEFLNRMGFRSLVKRAAKQLGTDALEEKVITRSTKKKGNGSEFEDVTISSVSAAHEAIEKLRCAPQIVVRVVRGEVGSLFGSTVDGVVLGAEQRLFFFPGKFIQQEKKIQMALAALLGDLALSRAAHDAKAEVTALESLGIEIPSWSFDTMLAAYLLSAGERNQDLPSIAARYASIQLAENASAFRQAEVITQLIQPLREALKEAVAETVLEKFELPLVPILRRMERVGILLERPYLATLTKTLQIEKMALEKNMMKVGGREFNPASPSQIAEILFTDLKLPTKGIRRGKTGYSTAAEELEKLAGAHPIIDLIGQHRELSKMLSTYVEVLPGLADKKGRVHTTFNQAVAATGRLSSSDPNVQNIPIRTELGRKIRRAFIAEEGFVLLSCDYSQIELRVVAALAKDKKMLEAFHHGEDIHTATAAAIYKVSLVEVTKDQRRIAKTINFGLIFGQGPQGLSQTADISFADAKKFIAAYFDVYTGIKEYMEQTKALAHELGYVETFFGRRRFLPEIHSMLHQVRSQAERMAINMPVQGTDADIMKLAMIAIDKNLSSISSGTRLLLQVHDELLFEVPEKEVTVVAAAIKDIMENVDKIGVPIVVDCKTGKNWDEMKKI